MSIRGLIGPWMLTGFTPYKTGLQARPQTILSRVVWLMVLLMLSLVSAQSAFAAKCLFISSYHRGYAWSDGVERGVRSVLDGQCELKQLDMDTKRHKDVESIKQKTLEAKALIESWQPDVVITADDNAAKYIIKPLNPSFVLFCIGYSLHSAAEFRIMDDSRLEVASLRAAGYKKKQFKPGATDILSACANDFMNASRPDVDYRVRGLIMPFV